MDSNKIGTLQKYLRKKRFRYAHNVRIRPNSNELVVVVLESMLGPTVTKTTTSRRQLAMLTKAIARDCDLAIEFLISKGQDQEDMETGLKASLRKRFPGVVEHCMTSLREDRFVDVWIDAVATITLSESDDVKSAVLAYLATFDLELGVIRLADSSAPLPSLMAILRALKTESPALPEELALKLTTLGFTVPSTRWVAKMLDSLRRRNRALRRRDGSYVLTQDGLDLVPHGRGSQGSDVARALALGRRKW